MSWARTSIAALLLLAAPMAAEALTQVSGPVQIGPSSGDGNAQNRSATLSTIVVNQGQLPDRLINVGCPGFGDANLLNGHVQPVGNVERNGLDLPGTIDGRATPVLVQIGLGHATAPMLAGTLVPCALYFEHAGQRIVVFTLGTREAQTLEP